MNARTLWHVMQVALATISGWLVWFFGGWDGLMIALVFFSAADYLIGLTRAIVDKKVSSRICRRGVIKKAITLIIVGSAHILDTYVIGGAFVRDTVILFFIGSEGISMLEHAAGMGVNMPPKLKEVLVQLHGGDKCESNK